MSEADDTIAIELDDTPAERRAAAATEASARPLELDLEVCRVCGARVPLNDDSVCRSCHGAQEPTERAGGSTTPMAEIATATDSLDAIVAESKASAEAMARAPRAALGSIRGPEAGYIAPTGNIGEANVVDSHVNDAAIAAIRESARQQREGAARMRARAIEAANADLQAKAEREGAIVPDERVADLRPALRAGDLVAGAAAEGHGVLVGWNGSGDLTRARVVETLAAAGLPSDWAPPAASAALQASRAIGTLKGEGYDVKAEKKKDRQVAEVKPYDKLWTVGRWDHSGKVGDSLGEKVMIVTLTDSELEIDGDQTLAARVLKDYNDRVGQELYKSSDISRWIADTLRDELDAVKFGVGWYVPRKHRAQAEKLCEAFSGIGWGTDWIVPALPIATSEQLRAGIVRGLSDEVDAVLHQLENERVTAKTKEDREDIGPKRATTFLRMLREVGGRVVAYGALLGAARVDSLRNRIHDAVIKLESSMSEDDAAIVARFANVWDEIEFDRRRNGGVL